MYQTQNTNYGQSGPSSAYPRTVSRQVSPAKPQKTPDQIILSRLLTELLQLGCLSGFKYFETYLRGREELLLKVFDESVVGKDLEWKDKTHVKVTSLIVEYVLPELDG
jgi:hypothetical protein